MVLTRSLLLAVLALLLALSSLSADDDADTIEREKLVGVWQGYVVEGKGENPDRGVVKLTLTITEGQMSATSKDGAEDLGQGMFELNLTSDPKQLTASRKKPNGQDQIYQGIYTFDGDLLKWCVDNGRNKRPAELVTKPGAGQYLLVLRRQTEKK